MMRRRRRPLLASTQISIFTYSQKIGIGIVGGWGLQSPPHQPTPGGTNYSGQTAPLQSPPLQGTWPAWRLVREGRSADAELLEGAETTAKDVATLTTVFCLITDNEISEAIRAK